MPARDARNAVRSSVLTQADVHFEVFSAGRCSLAELGLPSLALEFVGTDDAAGGAGRRLLRPVVLRGVDDPSTSEDPEFHASGGISGVVSERWEVVPEGQSRTRDGMLQALAARLKRRLGDEAYRALQVEVPPKGYPNIKSWEVVRAAPIFQLMPDHLWRLGFRDDSVLTALEQHDG